MSPEQIRFLAYSCQVTHCFVYKVVEVARGNVLKPRRDYGTLILATGLLEFPGDSRLI